MNASRFLLAAAVGVGSLTLTGCMSDTPQTVTEQRALKSDSHAALNRMYDRDPSLRSFVDNAYAYAIFPSVGKGGVIAGGAAGRGEVYEQGRLVGYASLNAVSVGAQVGGQELAELIVFENEAALRRFQDTETTFTLNASAVALKAGASNEAVFKDGITVFTLPTGGLMAEASVAGQQFRYQPLDAANARLSDQEMRRDASETDAEQATYRTRTEREVDVDVDVDRRNAVEQERRLEVETETRQEPR